MAQVLAVPGDIRHGFSYNCSFNHDFGRITGIAATIKENILLCDYDEKNLILVDPLGNYLKKLKVDSEPYDVAISNKNIGYITQPTTRSALQIDPDRMVISLKAACNEQCTTVVCASVIPNVDTCILSFNTNGKSYIYPAYSDVILVIEYFRNLNNISRTGGSPIGTHVIKFHAIQGMMCFSCQVGQNCITISKRTSSGKQYFEHKPSIATMDTPTDICSDDYGHLYVSGQGSNNIHRLTKDVKVIDIPLHSHHGIKQPVAMCFNQTYTKLYIVNEWGKSVLVFDVI